MLDAARKNKEKRDSVSKNAQPVNPYRLENGGKTVKVGDLVDVSGESDALNMDGSSIGKGGEPDENVGEGKEGEDGKKTKGALESADNDETLEVMNGNEEAA
jgi:hypothetical protein